jgi:hypothetical protein
MLILRNGLASKCVAQCFSLGDPSESPQTLRIDHEAGGGHEHGWNGCVVARSLLDSGSGSRGLPVIAATIARLDYVIYNPRDEPQPAYCRHGDRDQIVRLHPGVSHSALLPAKQTGRANVWLATKAVSSFQGQLASESRRAVAALLNIAHRDASQAFCNSWRRFLLAWQAGAFSFFIDSAALLTSQRNLLVKLDAAPPSVRWQTQSE